MSSLYKAICKQHFNTHLDFPKLRPIRLEFEIFLLPIIRTSNIKYYIADHSLNKNIAYIHWKSELKIRTSILASMEMFYSK